jgi:hypothetical protein
MNTYLLFINGLFEEPKDLDDFSFNFMQNVQSATSSKFIIENKYNVIVIFDSDKDDEEISVEIKEGLAKEKIRLFFLFNREDLMVATIPQEISSIVFRDLPEDSSLEINLINKEEFEDDGIPEDNNDEDYMDILLEKIDKFGIESLTKNEKKYLENFKK